MEGQYLQELKAEGEREQKSGSWEAASREERVVGMWTSASSPPGRGFKHPAKKD